MIKIDQGLLEELGLDALPPDEQNPMLSHIYETLEMRVGMVLASQMTDEQLEEFEGFIREDDEAGALAWLERNFRDYKAIVQTCFEHLKGEISDTAGEILQASGSTDRGQLDEDESNHDTPSEDDAA